MNTSPMPNSLFIFTDQQDYTELSETLENYTRAIIIARSHDAQETGNTNHRVIQGLSSPNSPLHIPSQELWAWAEENPGVPFTERSAKEIIGVQRIINRLALMWDCVLDRIKPSHIVIKTDDAIMGSCLALAAAAKSIPFSSELTNSINSEMHDFTLSLNEAVSIINAFEKEADYVETAEHFMTHFGEMHSEFRYIQKSLHYKINRIILPKIFSLLKPNNNKANSLNFKKTDRDNKKPKILFLSHEASLTGAPMILLELVRWLKQHYDFEAETIFLGHGKLERLFRPYGRTTYWHPSSVLSPSDWELKEVTKNLSSGKRPLLNGLKIPEIKRWKKENIKLIYANSIGCHQAIDALRELNIPIITHVHELETAYRYWVGPAKMQQLAQNSAVMIACAQNVADALVKTAKIDPSHIRIAHEFIPERFQKAPPPPEVKQEVRRELGIPDGHHLVGTCGSVDFRKGMDLFIEMAILTNRESDTPVHFVWVGGMPENYDNRMLEVTLEKVPCAEYIHFVGKKPNPENYYSAFDAFLMLSREDPFPLAMLEAGSMGTPIFCFKDSGGAYEYVEEDAGYAAAFLDIGELSEALLRLLQQPEELERMGQTAKKKVLDRFTLDVTGQKIASIIQEHIKLEKINAV